MVLADLGRRISAAVNQFCSTSVNIDENSVDDLLDEVSSALENADVNNRFVRRFRDRAKNTFLSQAANADGGNKHQLMKSIVFNELVKLVDPGVKAWQPVKGRNNVIMFVGLQGSGKTTTVTKLAHYYQKKGWKTCMICADTYRAGAYDQLKQNATKARIPYYGSYTTSDPVQIALEGVRKFKSENFEIILIDTSGRHRQDEALFEEMLQISNAVRPHSIVYIMDATNGQSCEGHARAFKATVDVASIIVSKLDGHAKGGGAISAVAATRSPIVFIGTGEHLDHFEPFRAAAFVQKLLGMGDVEGFIDRVKELRIENQEQFVDRFQRGLFALRDLHEYLQIIQRMGPLDQLFRLIPNLGLQVSANDEQSAGAMMRRSLVILDSMTAGELDCPDGVELFRRNPSRRLRVARGAGARPEEVDHFLRFYETAAPYIKRFSGLFRGLGLGPGARPGLPREAAPAPLDPSSLFSMVASSFGPAPVRANGDVAARTDEDEEPVVNGELAEFDLD